MTKLITNEGLEIIYKEEIEEKGIDEVSLGFISGIDSKYGRGYEFQLLLLKEKGFIRKKFGPPISELYLLQREGLNVKEVYDRIDDLNESICPRQNHSTLYEIVEEYKDLRLAESSEAFSLKAIIEKIDKLIIAKKKN